VSDNQIDIMLTEIDIAAQDMLMQSSCLPRYDGAMKELRSIVRRHIGRLPLPTVPTDATCGGCRYYKSGLCHSEPEVSLRSKSDTAGRYYEEAAK